MKTNINPEISPSAAEYFLSIYHDIGLELNEGTGQISKIFSFGHFYIGLSSGDQSYSYGFNPISALKIVRGVVKSEDDRLTLVCQFEKQSQENVLCTKVIPLTYGQYARASAFIEEWLGVEQKYMIGVRDCVDFVQDVYHATGLSLYFTKVFNKAELLALGTEVCIKVLHKYGARDIFPEMFTNIEASSIQELSSKLNLPSNQIVDTTNKVAPLAFYDSLAITQRYFTVFLDDKDYMLLDEVKGHTSAIETADLMRNLILSDKQVKEAKEDVKDFFGAMFNSRPVDSSTLVLSVEDLFPKSTAEDHEWLNEMMGVNDQIFANLGLLPAQSSEQFQYSDFAQTILSSSVQILADLQNLEINDIDKVD